MRAQDVRFKESAFLSSYPYFGHNTILWFACCTSVEIDTMGQRYSIGLCFNVPSILLLVEKIELETGISRVTRLKEEAKATYNKISKWYDLVEGVWEKKCGETGLQKLNVKDGEKVLEIGFGTGHTMLALAQAVGNSGKVYGIDISENMLDITQARIQNVGLSERVKLECGDAIKLPFEANFFDAIFMSFTLELFDTPEIPIVLDECRRVLRSGGRICVVGLSKKGKSNLIMRVYEWAHRKFPKYVDCRPIFVQRALEDAGFYILDATEMSIWGLPVEAAMAKRN